MVVMGIDPGTAICGYGVVEMQGSRLSALDYGCVKTESGLSVEKRLNIVFQSVEDLIKKHQPAVIGVEQLFFNTNVRTAMTVGQARGVILLAVARNNAHLVEVTPLQVKESVTGYGKADKEQVGYMVQRLLNLKTLPKPDDVTDALAVAICAGHYGSRVVK